MILVYHAPLYPLPQLQAPKEIVRSRRQSSVNFMPPIDAPLSPVSPGQSTMVRSLSPVGAMGSALLPRQDRVDQQQGQATLVAVLPPLEDGDELESQQQQQRRPGGRLSLPGELPDGTQSVSSTPRPSVTSQATLPMPAPLALPLVRPRSPALHSSLSPTVPMPDPAPAAVESLVDMVQVR